MWWGRRYMWLGWWTCASCECTSETGYNLKLDWEWAPKKATGKLTESKVIFNRTSRKQSASEQSKSIVADPSVQQNHVINWMEVWVLASENNQWGCYIKEVIYIHYKAIKTMNRDEEAQQLSYVYDPILRIYHFLLVNIGKGVYMAESWMAYNF